MLEEFIQRESYSSFISGEMTDKGVKSELVSPVTQKPWKKLLLGNKETTQKAIENSQQAYAAWKWVPPPLRGKYLRQCGEVMMQHKDLLANIMTMEMGKTYKDGIKEVEYSAGFYFWCAGEAERIYGITIPSQYPLKRLMVISEPIGVAGLITPWNFPLAMPARKIAAALAAGCTAVIKPSQESPLSTLVMAYILDKVGLPKGVLNVVLGDEKEIGEALLSSPIVRKLSFTGSGEVGKLLYKQSADTLKKMTMELGGNAPALVFKDADIDKAVDSLLVAKFRNNGQSCVAANRILIQDTIYDMFLEKFTAKVKALKVGDPLDPQTDISTILHPSAQKKLKRHIEDAVKKGAKVIFQGGNSIPTILSDVKSDMLVFKEETFGPLACFSRFNDDEEGISLANNTEYGLAAYLFTENISRGHFILGRLEFGIIGLNDGLPSTPQGSFGGIKNSGFGREGGPTAIHEYLVDKFISIGI